MTFVALLVADEKELDEYVEVLEKCKRVVGPIKVYSASKAPDGVAKLQRAAKVHGQVHIAFLSHHFTAPGKEEYSDALRKVLKDQYPDLPVVCWGNPRKGGKQGEHFHYGLEEEDAQSLLKYLQQAALGELPAEYKGKEGRKSVERSRKSFENAPRPSMDVPSERRRSLDRAPERSGNSELVAARRRLPDRQDSTRSLLGGAPGGGGGGGGEGPAAAGALRRRSLERQDSSRSLVGRKSISIWDDAGMPVAAGAGGTGGDAGMAGGMGMGPNMGMNMGMGFGGMQGGGMNGMGAPNQFMGMNPMAMNGMGNMGGMAMAGGMAGMGPNGMGGMVPGVAGMGAMGNMGGFNGMGAGGMAMGGFSGMGAMGSPALAPTSSSFNGVGGGVGMGFNLDAAAAAAAATRAPSPPPAGFAGVGFASLGSAGTVPAPAAAPAVAAPAPAAADPAAAGGAAAPADVAGLLASMNLGPGSSNADLIRMLAQEVVRLRQLLEDKKRRSSIEVQQQQ